VLSLDGEKFQKQAPITDEVYAEWTTFHHYIVKEDMSSQLYDLSTNETLKPIFPNLRTLANVCMSLPVGWKDTFQK